MRAPIRVLLVDDSPVALAVLKRLLSAAPDIQVVGTAADGREGLEQAEKLRPAVICTDLMMPVMDGLAFTQAVMARCPTPILVITSTIREEERGRSYPILEAGAMDVFPKPAAALGAQGEAAARELAAKVRVLSGVHVFRRYSHEARATAAEGASPASPSPASAEPAVVRAVLHARVVAIGASTGGPVVLKEILAQLPAGYPLPVLCVQHISEGFLQGFVDWLNAACAVHVRVAREGERPLPGTVYFPREKTHLEIDAHGHLAASTRDCDEGHRPSVTVTFEAAARYYGSGAVGVLLTGMGKDGAAGLAAISSRGGMTIAQNEASCAVFGMPRQAIELGAARCVLPPEQIAQRLRALRPV